MRGQAAVRARGKCPVCEEPFQEILKLGFICPTCQTTPRRFYVDVFWKTERIRLYSDEKGKTLYAYESAEDLRKDINRQIENHTFDPAKYVKAEAAKFYAENLLDRFLKEKKKTIAPSYVSHYERIVCVAKNFFTTQDVREIRKLDIINFVNDCREKFSWRSKTLKNHLDVFKTFMTYLKDDLEVIDRKPSFPPIEVEDPPVRWVQAKDQAKLFDQVRDEDKPIVGFLMLHGCRPGEARALKCQDIDLENQSITIHATFSAEQYREKRKGKRSRALVIPIHPEAIGYLTHRKRNALPEAFVFVNPRTGRAYTESSLTRLWQGVRKALCIGKELRLYDASRHSYASQLVNSGASLFVVGRLLGHTSTKTTEKHYAHADLNALRVEINKVSLKTVSDMALARKRSTKKP